MVSGHETRATKLVGDSGALRDGCKEVPELHDHLGRDVSVVIGRPKDFGVPVHGDPVAVLGLEGDLSERFEQGEDLRPLDVVAQRMTGQTHKGMALLAVEMMWLGAHGDGPRFWWLSLSGYRGDGWPVPHNDAGTPK